MTLNKQQEPETSEKNRERLSRKDFHSQPKGAKTFRRGRAIAFLEKLEQRRSTLKRQLETPELQSINPILVGELKATETIIDEFVLLFELNEFKDAAKESDGQ
ncbi:hypothetical protein QWY14_02920 [Planococcus sp. N028]|uniref:2-keto-3-deoxygluconate kinase n=1 Tax=Planococcus shixiaomingii TaxID=3058393 RepID=A0ABT8MYK1_9BACL|nr:MULTISPECIES: hypothetical protein [unclassified Planococcus (in: firmicutes)]MDN7240721.1 hypothetical protein [Planococcus sp. N028]WKA56625.1 hypothetical protein QWY21_09845 [Planococcus sp. N022]